VNNGSDWYPEAFMCSTEYNNQPPLNIPTSSNTTSFGFKFYVFPQFYTNISANISLQDFNNNLVLQVVNESSSFGVLTYMLNNSVVGVVEEVNLPCKKIFIRMPGEHVVDGVRYDMELQVYCTLGEITTFFALPVKISANVSPRSFLTNFGKAQLNTTWQINNLDDIFSPVLMFSRIFFYAGAVNYPDCDINKYWMYVEKVLTVDQSTYTKLFSLLDKTQAPTGNSRMASEPSTAAAGGFVSTIYLYKPFGVTINNIFNWF